MSAKADYTPEEWATLLRAPVLAGVSLTLADPGGPIEATKEAMATMKGIGSPGSDAELLVALSQDGMAMAQERKNPLGDYKLEQGDPAQQILDQLEAADAIVAAKGTPEEAAAFRAWIVATAQAAAEAAKEGGFLGIGAVRVSEGEQKMLDRIRETLGVAPETIAEPEATA